MAGFLSVGNFLLGIAFSLILLTLWLRVVLRYYRVSVLHPVGGVIYQITNPVFLPLEKQLYGQNKRLPRYDWLSLVAIFIVELIKFVLLGLVVYKQFLPVLYLIIFALADFIVQPCNFLFYALMLRVILSWINTRGQQYPAADILIMVTDPLIVLGRKIIPNISGFDFSPFIIMIILKVITLFISASMPLGLV